MTLPQPPIQNDPLLSIRNALNTIFTAPPFNLKYVILGWPDTKEFDLDNNLPTLSIFSVSDSGTHLASRETIHAVVPNPDGTTVTMYKETLRVTYLLQLTLFTYTEADRNSLGWMIEQYLVNNPQLLLDQYGVETAMFKYKTQRDDHGETKLYQRSIDFDVSARVLNISSQYKLNNIQFNDNSPLT